MSEADLPKYQNVAIKLAIEAGELMKVACGRIKSVQQKSSPVDLVTEADKGVEAFVFGELKKQFPNFKFIGEETANQPGQLTDDPTWIVDPIDGTMNFVHTFPFACIAIGLTMKKQPVLGVVYSPFLDKLFTAVKGQGAKLNGIPIETRKTAKTLKESLVIYEVGQDRSEEKKKAVHKCFEALAWNCHSMRTLGSAALNICFVAAGYADAFFEFGIHSWDMCAGVVVAQEAGAHVCDTKGGPFDLLNRRLIVATTEELAQELSKTIPVHMDFPRD